MIRTVDDASEKRRIAREILEALPEWFGISEARENYMLYDNTLNSGDETAQNLADLAARMAAIGHEIVTDRGDARAR